MQYLLVFGVILTFSLSRQYVSAEPYHTPSIILNSTEVCPSKSAINEVKRIAKSIINLKGGYLSRPCKCGDPDWTMVGYLNMSNPSHHCPANWSMSNDSVRGCGRRSSGSRTCDSVLFPVNDLLYSSVCGRIVAYQRGTSVAFLYSNRYSPRSTIEDPYVSGISLTHGAVGSRQHIWTFAGANGQLYRNHGDWYCSCTNTSVPWPYQVPSYVGNDYFCDSGNPGNLVFGTRPVYLDDPLWDGAGCNPSSNSCCQLNNPPWFCKHLQNSFTDDLELRLCAYNSESYGSTLITLMEIYVK